MQQITFQSLGIYLVVEFIDNCDPVDVSSAVTKTIVITDPTGTKTTFTASFRTDGTDGQIQYLSVNASDFDPIGIYQIYGRVVFPGTDWRTIPQQFEVVAL